MVLDLDEEEVHDVVVVVPDVMVFPLVFLDGVLFVVHVWADCDVVLHDVAAYGLGVHVLVAYDEEQYVLEVYVLVGQDVVVMAYVLEVCELVDGEVLVVVACAVVADAQTFDLLAAALLVLLITMPLPVHY